jgi:hypothetical protein
MPARYEPKPYHFPLEGGIAQSLLRLGLFKLPSVELIP